MIETEISYDPQGTYKGIAQGSLMAACGMIPFFVQEVALSDPLEAEEAFTMMLEAYGYGGDNSLENGKGKVLKDGTYTFPGDPDLSPYVSFEINGEKDKVEILVYPYGFVCVRDAANTYFTRMD